MAVHHSLDGELLVRGGGALLDAFDDVADVFIFTKDRERRFVQVSEPFVRLMGCTAARQLLGLRDEDISPEHLAAHYRIHDELVLRDGERIIDLVELVHSIDGSYDWFLTTKLPVRSASGDILGLVGVTRALTRRQAVAERVIPLTPAVKLISKEFHRHLTVEEMAATVSMSPSHFSRVFREHFQVTPHRYLRRVRLMAACELLSTTDLPISAVASRTGYYDQSHLSNDLARERGMSPTSYRRRFRDESSRMQPIRTPLG